LDLAEVLSKFDTKPVHSLEEISKLKKDFQETKYDYLKLERHFFIGNSDI
jgi:hypothetical protein